MLQFHPKSTDVSLTTYNITKLNSEIVSFFNRCNEKNYEDMLYCIHFRTQSAYPTQYTLKMNRESRTSLSLFLLQYTGIHSFIRTDPMKYIFLLIILIFSILWIAKMNTKY